MKTLIENIVVVGNSDSFGIEVGKAFNSVADCVDSFVKMKSPSPLSWPSIMNSLGFPTLNYSTPASGFFNNFSKVLELHKTYSNSLFLIDISLFDHLCDENLEFRSRNTSLFSDNSIEKTVFTFSIEQQIFMLNEFKKILKKNKIKFKFISLGNVFFDYSSLSKAPDRELYAEQIRDQVYKNYPVMPTDLYSYFLFEQPYAHLLPKDAISKYCHINQPSNLNKLAQLVLERVLINFEFINNRIKMNQL